MRVNLFLMRIATLGFFVLATNCGNKKTEPKDISASTVNVAAKAAAPAGAQKCENGQAPQVLSGECSGAWAVKKTDGTLNCEFEWKPRVTCPAGMQPLGLQAACYGVTVRPATDAIKTSEACLAAYGKHPISPAYKLECCQ